MNEIKYIIASDINIDKRAFNFISKEISEKYNIILKNRSIYIKEDPFEFDFSFIKNTTTVEEFINREICIHIINKYIK
jgi:hypothetical protein